MDSDSDLQEGESSEDEDYVPEDDSESADSEFEEGSAKAKKAARTEKKKKYPSRRLGGIRLRERPNVDASSPEESEEEQPEFETLDDLKRINAEEKEKERVDNLWESFKADTADSKVPPKSSSDPSGTTKPRDISSEKQDDKPQETEAKYSFAGEDVFTSKPSKSDTLDTSKDPITVVKENKNESEISDSKKPIPPGPSKRSGLGAILGSISKKPKISTLEKSKLDWQSYKEEKGLEDELKSAKDSGYLDRQDFLQRTDVRQFNIEKEARLSTLKFRK